MTVAQLKKHLIADYNEPPCSLEIFSQTTLTAIFKNDSQRSLVSRGKLLASSTISDKDFKKRGGGKTTLICELDASKIAMLANSSLKVTRKNLANFKVTKGKRENL
ncbi:MAG TPA: hypothetical protein VGJ00_05975 [Rhabdochlamydiaceae bacterium]